VVGQVVEDADSHTVEDVDKDVRDQCDSLMVSFNADGEEVEKMLNTDHVIGLYFFYFTDTDTYSTVNRVYVGYRGNFSPNFYFPSTMSILDKSTFYLVPI